MTHAVALVVLLFECTKVKETPLPQLDLKNKCRRWGCDVEALTDPNDSFKFLLFLFFPRRASHFLLYPLSVSYFFKADIIFDLFLFYHRLQFLYPLLSKEPIVSLHFLSSKFNYLMLDLS